MSKKKKKDKADVHDKLKGFDIKINEFGELTSNLPIDDLNAFLNENLVDKKFDKSKEEE